MVGYSTSGSGDNIAKLIDLIVEMNTSDLLRLMQRARTSQGLQSKESSDAQYHEAFVRLFTRHTVPAKRSMLEKTVEHHHDTMRKIKSARVRRAYAVACAYVDKLSLGYHMLTTIKHPTTDDQEAMGLMAFSLGHFRSADTHLQASHHRSHASRTAHVMARYELGEGDAASHLLILEPALDRSWLANTVMGTINFNNGDYDIARPYLARAAEMSPQSEIAQVNLLRVRSHLATLNPLVDFSAFYARTHSKLSPEELSSAVAQENMSFPELETGQATYLAVRKLLFG